MKYLTILLTAVLWLGCSASKEMSKTDDLETDEVTYDESFDPLTLNDDDLELPQVNLSNSRIDNNIIINNTQPSVQKKEAHGFRVQIIATQDIEKATLLEEEARNQFSPFGHEAYLIFEAPLYKIRIGNFSNRNQAEDLKEKAIKMGYRESFIVRTKVILSEVTQDTNY